MTTPAPDTQRAVQLVGPDQLELNAEKSVAKPGPHQILGQVEVVGLCFSDLKLLKQFSGHVRKSDVITGVEPEVLNQLPTYVPNDTPTVPGHETVLRIIEVGEDVTHFKAGDRCLVQADFRWLKTAQSNGAFGYNFEGALQEYVLLDERVILSPDGQSMLIPADETLPASAVALVEPWACVEDSYVVKERQTIKEGGFCMVAAANGVQIPDSLKRYMENTKPGTYTCLNPAHLDDIEDESIDDLIFYGADADRLERLFPKVAKTGLVVIVQCGQKFERPINSPVGRLHYGGVRIVGVPGFDIRDAFNLIPATGELRKKDRVDIVGAGGPMGTMHTIRDICQGVEGIEVWAGDMSDERLAQLDKLCTVLAEQNGVKYTSYNAGSNPPEGDFDYIASMVPSAGLVASCIGRCAKRGIINIFAGIPATVYHELDLDTYISKGLYFIGTSGSVIEDMYIVLKKVTEKTLDTNLSVAAISGLDGAVDGIRAVENAEVPGKIIVYPKCKGLGLTPLGKLGEIHPEVAELLDHGFWTQAAEAKLIELYS